MKYDRQAISDGLLKRSQIRNHGLEGIVAKVLTKFFQVLRLIFATSLES